MTNEDFPAPDPDEPLPPEETDLDVRSQPIEDEPDEPGEAQDPSASGGSPDGDAGGGSSSPGPA